MLPIDPIVASSGTRTTSLPDLGIDVAPLHRFTPQDRAGSPSQQRTLEASQSEPKQVHSLAASFVRSARTFVRSSLQIAAPEVRVATSFSRFLRSLSGTAGLPRNLSSPVPKPHRHTPNLIRATGDFCQPAIHSLLIQHQRTAPSIFPRLAPHKLLTLPPRNQPPLPRTTANRRRPTFIRDSLADSCARR